MLSSIILEKLPPEIKLLITRNMNQDIWDLTQMLEIFNQEFKARETCLPSAPAVRILNLTLNMQAQRYVPLLHLEAKILQSHL